MLPAFPSLTIRARIGLAILGLSVGTLIVMAIAVYLAFERELWENLDDTVRLRAASNLQLVDSTQSPPALLAGPDPGKERLEGEAVLRLFDTAGNVLEDASPAAETSPEEKALVLRAVASGGDVYASIDLSGDEDYRAVASPVRAGGEITGVLVTGIERSQVDEPLAVLRLILAFAVPATSIVLALGSFWIARLALSPVSRITATAKQITRGDLKRRIEGVKTKDEVGELAATLNAMIGRLAETVERERRFTADASHELRTPLSAIETSIDVTLSQERASTDYRHALESVRGQAHRLSRLTRQLLLLSRLDSDGVQREFEKVDLGGLVEAVAATFADANPEARVSVEGSPEPVGVRGDIELLARALMNILENAVTHVRPSVAVSLRVSRPPGTGRAVVTISDDGPGIPTGLASEVFQRFRRGDAARSTGGTGLGLAIVEEIMTLHGGSVRLAPSGAGAGARFELSFPLAA
jgi:two-component system OmpR family sensor kinase